MSFLKKNYTFLLLVFIGLLALIGEALWLDLYYEEPRRIAVAISMLKEGAWIVPKIFGEIYLKKPPGYNWFIALISFPFGSVTPFLARLTAIFSWLGLGGVVYWLAGSFKTTLARQTAALSALFALTIYLEKAALAEIDLFLTLMLTAALGCWFYFHEKNQPWTAWLTGHFFFLLAFFAKGPVAHLFFYFPILVHYIFRRDKTNWTAAASGFVSSHLVIGLWVSAVVQKVGWETLIGITWSETARVDAASFDFLAYALQLFKYPLITFFSFFPFCLLFLVLFSRKTRTDFIQRATSGSFWLGIIGTTPFLVFWVLPVDSIRYALPIFPFLALLTGGVIETLAENERLKSTLNRLGTGLGVLLLILTPVALSFQSTLFGINTSIVTASLLAVAGLIILIFIWRRGLSAPAAVAVLVVFILLLKTVFLFSYIPAHKPERLELKNELQPLIEYLKTREINTIIHRSDGILGVACVLHGAGFDVVKYTGKPPTRDGYYLTRGNRLSQGLEFIKEFERGNSSDLKLWRYHESKS